MGIFWLHPRCQDQFNWIIITKNTKTPPGAQERIQKFQTSMSTLGKTSRASLSMSPKASRGGFTWMQTNISTLPCGGGGGKGGWRCEEKSAPKNWVRKEDCWFCCDGFSSSKWNLKKLRKRSRGESKTKIKCRSVGIKNQREKPAKRKRRNSNDQIDSTRSDQFCGVSKRFEYWRDCMMRQNSQSTFTYGVQVDAHQTDPKIF